MLIEVQTLAILLKNPRYLGTLCAWSISQLKFMLQIDNVPKFNQHPTISKLIRRIFREQGYPLSLLNLIIADTWN